MTPKTILVVITSGLLIGGLALALGIYVHRSYFSFWIVECVEGPMLTQLAGSHETAQLLDEKVIQLGREGLRLLILKDLIDYAAWVEPLGICIAWGIYELAFKRRTGKQQN